MVWTCFFLIMLIYNFVWKENYIGLKKYSKMELFYKNPTIDTFFYRSYNNTYRSYIGFVKRESSPYICITK